MGEFYLEVANCIHGTYAFTTLALSQSSVRRKGKVLYGAQYKVKVKLSLCFFLKLNTTPWRRIGVVEV
jgi:hypothetical protein